jgi:hypothetical protein
VELTIDMHEAVCVCGLYATGYTQLYLSIGSLSVCYAQPTVIRLPIFSLPLKPCDLEVQPSNFELWLKP